MYKVIKDDARHGRFVVKCFMEDNVVDPLYSIENLIWGDVQKFVKHEKLDENDLLWMHDLIRLLDKRVSITDAGNWSIL